MKKFFLVLVALIPALASADSLYPRRPSAQLQLSYFGRSIETTLDNYGTVTITDVGQRRVLGRTQLQVQNFTQLSELSYGLSLAPVKSTRSATTCMMMPLPVESALLVSTTTRDGQFTGNLRLVLSVEQCYVENRTAPINEFDLSSARQLRTVLEFVTYEIAKLPQGMTVR